MGQFRHHHSGKSRTWLCFGCVCRITLNVNMFQRYMLRSLLTQSFNIVNTPIILLFSKKWVPGNKAVSRNQRISISAFCLSTCWMLIILVFAKCFRTGFYTFSPSKNRLKLTDTVKSLIFSVPLYLGNLAFLT